ncbi:sugar transferase [Devosia sp.]|uniref:sugar transferase n=1 Tax=Devosia sp. TaxID=1871048 RepID=UPI002602D777|nr:sugar transferase [Devosia sp.]
MTPNTSHILNQGGTLRDHRFMRDVRLFIVPTVVAIVLQGALYATLLRQAGRSDWLVPVAVIAGATILSALMLTAFRRHQYPLTSSALLTAAMYCVAVTVLSALRIRVSYFGLTLAAPIAIGCLAYANMRFHKAISDNVALLEFPGAQALAVSLGVPIAKESDEIDQLLIDPGEPTEPGQLNRYYMRGVEIVPWMLFLETRQGRVDVASFDISHIRLSPTQLLYTRAKRLLDILAVLVTLPITVPLSLLVAGFILLRHGRPVLFIQKRFGYGGQHFSMMKFRTMHEGSEGHSAGVGDKRVFAGGRFLRRLRLDELPQLYNVLIGEMSLIGPRPVSDFVATQCEATEPKYGLRYLVQPGITGWAQVNSGYATTTEEEMRKLSFDLYYIKHQSFDLDLQIIFRTLLTLVLGKGAR